MALKEISPLLDNSYNNITPLALASTLGSTDIISSLLIGKANINYKMKDGKTALIWAEYLQKANRF